MAKPWQKKATHGGAVGRTQARLHEKASAIQVARPRCQEQVKAPAFRRTAALHRPRRWILCLCCADSEQSGVWCRFWVSENF